MLYNKVKEFECSGVYDRMKPDLRKKTAVNAAKQNTVRISFLLSMPNIFFNFLSQLKGYSI